MRTWIWLVTTGGTGRVDTAQFLPRTAAAYGCRHLTGSGRSEPSALPLTTNRAAHNGWRGQI